MMKIMMIQTCTKYNHHLSCWWRWWWWVGQNTKSSFEMLSVGIYSLHPYVPCGAIIFVPITPFWNRILFLEIHSPCPDLCPRVSYCGAGHKYNNSDLTRILHKGGKQIPINCFGSFPQFFPRMLQLSSSRDYIGFLLRLAPTFLFNYILYRVASSRHWKIAIFSSNF